jgi:hypothetical protein
MTGIPDDFVCGACGLLKDFYAQAVILGSKPEDAEFWVTGMPCVFTGFCLDCLEGVGE